MVRHHGNWKAICLICDNFFNNECSHRNLKLKKTEVLNWEYVDFEITVMTTCGGEEVYVFPTNNFIWANTGCSTYERWLITCVESTINDYPKGKAIQCGSFKRYNID